MAGVIVQTPTYSVDDGGGTATTGTAVITGVTAGNSILVFAGWSDAGTVTATCSDGTAYTSVAAKVRNTTDSQSSQVFMLENAGAGTHTVVVTFSTATSFRRVRLIEVSGTATSSSLDQATGQQQAAPGTGADAVSSGASSATTNANDFVIGFTQNTTQSDPGSGTLAAGTGYTIAGLNLIMGIASKNVSATGAQTATFTQSVGTNNRTTHVVALKQFVAGPTITVQPNSTTSYVGSTATFTADAAGATGYQWKKNGSNVVGGTGGTSATYTTPTLVIGDQGNSYTCDITDGVGTSTTRAAILTLPSPTIVGPYGQTTAVGGTATFTVAPDTNYGALSYQWQDTRTGLFTNVASGGTSSSYTTPATDATYQGRSYRCSVTNANGTSVSSTAALSMAGFPVYLWSTAVQAGNDVWLRDPLSQGASGLTLALTGQAVTAAPGTVAAAVSLVLSGQGVTVASDTITAATGAPVTVALSGQGLTAATGTLVPDRSIATSGTAVGVASGTLAPSASVAIAGTGVTVASGLIGPAVSLTLSGTAVGASTGLLTPSVNITLNGQGLTGVSGALTASIGGNLTLALTGQDAFTAAGTLSTGVSIALSGQAVTSAAGTLGVSVGPALSGQAATFATGLLTPALTLTLAGTPVVGGTGSLTALIPGDVTLALSGQDASFVAGNLIASSGNLATGGIRVGSLRGFERKTLTKAQIREQQIALGIIKDFPQQAAIEVVKGFIDPDISSADLEDVGSEIAEQSARMARLLGLVVEWQQIQDAIAMQVRIRRDEEQAILLVLTAYQAWQ